MNEKQQQLTFEKGITNVPSDAICSDNTLAESIGMMYIDGEHKVIQKPVLQMRYPNGGYTTYKILYIHNFNSKKRYVAWKSSGHYSVEYNLVWCTKEDGVLTQQGTFFSLTADSNSDSIKVTSVGKTLIVSSDTGIKYFLWSYDNNQSPIYEFIGDSLPKPEIFFKLGDRNEKDYKEEQAAYDTLYNVSSNNYDISLGKNDEWNNIVVGLYSKLKKKIWQDKKFHGSFCIRAALELYDGTFFHISNPIFMVNHFSEYGVAWINDESAHVVHMHSYGQNLYYKFTQDFTKWNDIIRNVVLFVTEEAKTVDSTVDAICKKGRTPDTGDYDLLPDAYIAYFMSGNHIYNDTKKLSDQGSTEGELYRVLKPIPDTDLAETIKDGVYYKLCEIGKIGNNEWKNAGDHFSTHTLENLTTQQQLEEDDFYSHCPLKTEYVYAYNSRLNIANVSRGFFSGFENFMPFDNTGDPSSYRFLVTIQTDGGEIVVEHTASTIQKQGLYFYYPDARAKHVDIFKGNIQIINQDLTEHPSLNGAYYFAGVSPSMDEPSSATSHEPTVSNNPMEQLPNYVIQSEVNNPFVFKAAGYFKVGTGQIYGMASTTQALSEGQFGQFPLLVFSENGIWALTVADTGYYGSIHPISREVCSNKKSITQTDGAVYFVSKKGLMVVDGSKVVCVSEQLSGKMHDNEILIDEFSFNKFLQDAFIAYDYRDSLLWLFNTNIITVTAKPYIYSIKSGTYGRVTSDWFGNRIITGAINDYPDYLLSGGTEFLSLTDRPDINEDGTTTNNVFTPNRYTANLFSRPMKLENAFALKSIMQIKHIHDMNDDATLTFRLYASNDLKHWVELTSLRGVPWKYYRFRYDFSDLIATDRFAGTMLITQERRTNKMR